ncbi:glutathione peroxidase [soil metagenome]
MMRTISALALALPVLVLACSSEGKSDGVNPPASDAGVTQKDAGNLVQNDASNGDAATTFECNPAAEKGSIYALSSENLGNTRNVSLCEFRGQVMLIVNVASACGYTPQYTPLEDLYLKYKAQKFSVLGFPCNQFGAQESGTDEDISTFCTTKYNITFPMFTKSNVNAPTENPIYSWLKAQPGGAGDISWNFNKFLIGRDGKVLKRYDSAVEPTAPQLIADIEAALKK